MTPVFYGCYDWHSAVHSHWSLLRACRFQPTAAWSNDAIALLESQFQPEALAAEERFMGAAHRAGFERPYGLAWLLQLTSELRQSLLPLAPRWLDALMPLETLAISRFHDWLPRLPRPNRTGEHSQTAFALGLLADWAVVAGHEATQRLVRDTAWRFHADDVELPLSWEPGPFDFLSPALAEADLMRRCLPPTEFAAWLTQALPESFRETWELHPVTVADFADGKLAHYAGLNFSRAWMSAGIAAGLPHDDPRRMHWQTCAAEHLSAALPALASDEYAITHWVGSFAMYVLTDCGLMATAAPTVSM
ncbi:MAG: hypothetical protein B7Z55_11755 [Planctomycetales bacterium 12-60-4]|nr:MAG: hypothetical protein B7Z55_11755 [Planctomycetales bacterium 12-60-4]